MDVEIFVHGVPNGESFWGKDEDRNYFGNFYDQSCSDKVRFLVQTRSSNGKIYCYYNYLVYGNVVGNDGRDGSYFGLSVRFDAYCKDFMSVYKVLDVVFCTDVVHKILKVQNGNYKYIIPDFSNASDVLNHIKSRIWELIQAALTKDSISFLNGFNTNGSQLPSANLYETTNSEVEAVVRRYGKIAISPYYQTSSERRLVEQYEEKLNAEKQQCEARIQANATASENKITQKDTELSSLRTTNDSLTAKISQKNEIIKELKGKIQNFELTKQSIKIIEDIKAPVMELASNLGYQAQSDSIKGYKGKSQSFIKPIIPWINTILGVIVISILISPSKEKIVERNASLYALNDTIKELRAENKELRAENEELKYQLQSLRESKDVVTEKDGRNVFSTESYVSPESFKAHIDVLNYNVKKGAYLKTGKQHTAIILGANNPGWQKWSIKGGDIIGEDNGASVDFKPTSNDVTLTYENSDGDYIERKLIAKK